MHAPCGVGRRIIKHAKFQLNRFGLFEAPGAKMTLLH